MTSQVQIILYFFGPIHSAGEYYRAMSSLSLSSISSSVSTSCAAMPHAAESLDKDEVPQDLIDI